MITVFTTAQCAYCKMVKMYLSSKGKDFEVVELDDKPELREELKAKTGVSSVPITQVDDKYIIGWNPAQLGALI